MPAKRRLTAEDLYALQLVEDPQLSPDGRHLAFVKVTHDKLGNQYRRHIWLTTLDGEAGARTRQFTCGPKSDTAPRWSPDGQTLAFVSVRGEKPQIHLIDLAGGEARPLTAQRNGATNPVWSPDGRRLAFASLVNADECQREDEGREDPPPADSLEARHRKEAAEQQEKLKSDPRVITRLPYRTGTEYLDDRFTHLYVIDVPANGGEAPKPVRLTDGDLSFTEITWAGDGRALISTQSHDPEHDPFFKVGLVRIAVPARGAKPRRKLEYLTGPDYEYFAPRVSPDGQWIAALRREEKSALLGHVAQVVVLPARGSRQAAERAARDLAAPLDRSIDSVQWSPDSCWVYFQAQDQGRVGVYRAPVAGPPALEQVVAGNRTVTGFSVDQAGSVAFTASTPLRPGDLYYQGANGQAERQLTDFNRKLLGELELGRTEEVRYTAPDGQKLQGWLIKPPGFKNGQKYPLALHLHGGPHLMWGASTPGMWLEWHHHAARGYAVFFCNPRGATGYGEAFANAIHNDWGDHVMCDILAGVDHVVARGFIDTERLVITGGSYAGYMTAWIVAHDHRFKCAWAQRGLYSLLSFFGTTDIPQLIEREFDMLPFDDIEKSWRQSPLAYVRGIQTPLALEHQDQDYRCPVSEAEQLYAALKRLKREVVLYRYPREGHEMSRGGEPRHRVDRLNRMVDWFDRYTQPRPPRAG